VIVRSEPEMRGEDPFCNAICLTGYEAEEREKVNVE
jgi:hypothetical protein